MISLPMAPEKAAHGEPCNGCGFCCAAEVCEVGLAVYGRNQVAPCPGLEFRNGRFWCGVVRMADDIGNSEGLLLRLKLGIGFGCDAEDFAKQRT